MSQITSTELYENITHITASAPYSIHYTQVPTGCELALYLHWHNEMEFFLLISGDINFRIENQVYPLHSGDCIFIPPRLLHYANSSSTTPVSFFAFVLSPDFILSSFDVRLYNTYILPIMHNNLSFTITLQNDAEWKKDIISNLNRIFSHIDANELYIRGLSLLIWEQLYHHHLSKQDIRKSLHTLTDQLSDAITYIQNNYSKDITLKNLASCVHLSEGQFCRSFKLLTGLTPFRYLNRYRILQSCNELNHTNKKITDIATMNGFNNISYYNREFMKLMKMTPSEYRKSMVPPL